MVLVVEVRSSYPVNQQQVLVILLLQHPLKETMVVPDLILVLPLVLGGGGWCRCSWTRWFSNQKVVMVELELQQKLVASPAVIRAGGGGGFAVNSGIPGTDQVVQVVVDGGGSRTSWNNTRISMEQ